MNHITVDIYRDFECIAGACPDTCCAGWRIDIDEGSLIVSCPEVLAILMEKQHKQHIQFDFSEDNTHGDPYPYYSLYFYESKVRSCMMDILQNNPDITFTTSYAP